MENLRNNNCGYVEFSKHSAQELKMTRIFAIRHAEREDHMNFEWQNTAHRTHDTPLSRNGLKQAEDCGNFLKDKLVDLTKIQPVFLISPLNRCILTAKGIIKSLGIIDTVPLKIEQGFAEGNSHLKDRMFGTHRVSNKKNAITGKKRGMMNPVLLGAGDLLSVAYPASIDFTHETIHEVKYTKNCFEVLDPKKTPKKCLESEDRMRVVIPKFISYLEKLEKDENKELVVFIISHGAPASSFTRLITKSEDEIRFDYCTTVEIIGEGSKFTTGEVWKHPDTVKNTKDNLA